MKVEQKIVMVYTILGIILGFLTNNLYLMGFGLLLATTTSFAIYFSTLPILLTIVKKKTMLFYNSFITFLLIWLTVWILLYNLGG